MEDLAATAAKALREGNTRHLYNTPEQLNGKYSRPERPVK